MDAPPVSLPDIARAYLRAGLPPIELPACAKGPPPTGRTGYGGIDMTEAEVDAALWAGGVGIRMPHDVIGIDVDAYRGGAVTLRELIAECGPLPKTWISHSGRNDDSGIRLFRVPVGFSWITGLSGIDIIQHDHRYVVVWPSMHPEGRQYGWWDQSEAAPTTDVPLVEDLPDLPWAWINKLARANAGDVESGVRSSAASFDETQEFVAAHTATDAPTYITTIVEHFIAKVAANNSRHDTMQHCLIWAMECCRAGIASAYPTIVSLGAAWQTVHPNDTRRAETYSPIRVTEFEAMLRFAVGKAKAHSPEFIAKLHDDIAIVKMNVPPKPDPDVSHNGEAHPDGIRRVTLTPASSIRVRPVKWLWLDRVALGSLALVGGREGIGKSILTYQVVADITCGKVRGLHYGIPQSVLVCATEDSWEHTIVPRLMAAKADLDRVFRIDVTTIEGVAGTLTLPTDLLALEAAVAEVQAVAIVLDPLMSRLSTNLDTHKDAEVRVALEPLVALADRTGVAVLGLIHVNKATSTDPLTMLMASRAFAAVARAVLFVALDPADETGQRRYLGQPKNNLGTTDLPLLAFTISSALVAMTDEGEVWTGQVTWQGEDSRSIADVLRTAGEAPATRTVMADAAGWLSDYLVMHLVASSEDIKKAGKGYGHPEHALKRARADIGAGITNHGFPRRTWWSKPGMSPDEVDNWLQSEHPDGA